jgi:hypothetical protein
VGGSWCASRHYRSDTVGSTLTSLLALGVAIVGSLTAGAGGIVAATTTGDAIPAVLSGSGAAAAVGALVYITKKFVDGSVVALPVSEIIHKYETHVKEDHHTIHGREEIQKQLQHLLEDTLKDNNTVLARVAVGLERVTNLLDRDRR